ncbi:MAG TPA: GNAT family N-acetyltransferase [Clostridiaceae bacterium]|nr:GNAT family N-acetyltransferase [Clostridiaceae bacterium]
MSFHEMQIDDYNEIYELWYNTPGVGLSNADKRENIERFLARNKGLSFFCKHGGKIIGTIMCGHDGRRGHIYHLAVAENYRGKGIGRRLVEMSLERLKSEGIDKCHIFVYPENDIGNGFWTSRGWIKREDVFVYSKSI